MKPKKKKKTDTQICKPKFELDSTYLNLLHRIAIKVSEYSQFLLLSHYRAATHSLWTSLVHESRYE